MFYVVIQNHKPIAVVTSLIKAKMYCESIAGNGWDTSDNGCTRYSLGGTMQRDNIIDFRIYAVPGE